MIHEGYNLKSVILGDPLHQYARDHTKDLADFGASLAHWISRLQVERDELRERVAVLERECDGLKLALRRAT
jgi:predicted nucleotidyltransferase